MSENLGTIYYIVDARTEGLIAGSRRVESATGVMNRSFAQTDRIATKLTATFAAVTAALSTNKILAYGEAWVNVNNKLANSVRAHETLADVTDRVFKIAQETSSGLEGTAALYGRLERATRTAGTSTKDLITLTETINKGLGVSGATTQEASSAMIQLSQALASGVLRGEEFNSISENGSRIAVALADSLGVTIGELRGMAAQGKLTTSVVVNGLLKQSIPIAKEFNNTIVTTSQSFEVATNNITKFIGESSAVKTVMGQVGAGAISLSNNLDSVIEVATVLAVVVGSKLAGSFVQFASAKLSDAKASQANAVANSEAAAAVLRRAVAEKDSTVALLAKSRADVIATKGTSAHAFALDMVRQRTIAAANATGFYNTAMAASVAASNAASVAARVAATAMTALKGAMAFLGGPAGVALLAAYAIYEFGIKANETKDKTKALDGSIAELTESYKKLGVAQAKLEQFRVSEQLDSIYPLLSALEKQKTTLEGSIAAQEELAKKYKDISPKTYENLNASIATQKTSLLEVNSELETQYSNLDRIEKKQELINKVVADGAVSTNKPKTGVTLTGDQIKNIEAINSALADQRAELTKTADGYEEYSLRKKLAANGASEAVIQASLRELKAQQELRKELEIMNQVDADTQTQKLKVQTDYEQTGKQITADLETPAQKAERELAERLEVIRTYNALETAEDAKKTEMGMLALDAYAAKIQEINAKTKESNFASTLSDSFVGLQNQISGTMAQVALGFKDGDEAAKSLATTILTELVGAMINYGIKQAWAYTFGAAASTAAAATQTTAAVAATTAATTVSVGSAAAIAAAWATPAALVSAATFGASAVAGTAALTAAVAASGAMALASQSVNAGIGAAGAIAGGKLYGGTVQSGTMYPVNENGAPELFQSGNKQYLMPNSRGEVISNKDATSSGSSSGETMVNFTYSPSIQALDSDGVATILAEQQETLWNLVQRAANERGRKL